MGKSWEFTKGLHDLGNGAWAYLQPDGSWGWSNAGLVTDGDQALLVDTLFDEVLTDEMLRSMQDATGFTRQGIQSLVNTHANGDHTYGNGLLENAEIIASEEGAKEQEEVPPEMLDAMVKGAPDMGELGDFVLQCFGDFKFEGISPRKPTKTFNDKMTMSVGDKQVELIEVGPAHTRGDVLVHVPDDKIVYTGDILFIDGTPIMWEGPVSNWIRACDLIMDMDAVAIVPGHGPITDQKGVQGVKDYLNYINVEARKRYEAGMPADEAAKDIALGDFSSWGDAERIAVNVSTLYKEYSGDTSEANVVELFTLMAALAKR